MKKLTTCILFVAMMSSGLFAQDCTPTANETLEIGNVAAGYMNGGDMFWDLNSAKYEVPKGSGKNSIFSASIWMSGVDQYGALKTAAVTYRQSGIDFAPGPLCTEGDAYPNGCSDFDHIWKVSRSDIDAQLEALADGATTIGALPSAVAQWPGRNNPHFSEFQLPVDKSLAPFIDNDNDGIYNPLAGDVPRINGDQALWWVFNDTAGEHSLTNSAPLGVEVSILAYAFAEEVGSTIGNHTFLEVSIYNPSDNDLSDFYFGYFVDPDLGTFNDDYVGCNPEANMGISYNGDAFDDGANGYGADIPVWGVKTMQGLKADDGTDLGMSSFLYYNNDFSDFGNPETYEHYSNLLSGLNKVGDPFLDPDGNPTQYLFPDNPNDVDGWSECTDGNAPADRRFLMSSGPATLSSNEKQTVHLAVVWQEIAIYPCPDYEPLLALGEAIETDLAEVISLVDNLEQGSCELSADILTIERNVLNVFPNPLAAGVQRFSIEGLSQENLDLRIVNAAGKRIWSGVVNPNQEIEIDHVLSKGIYLLELSRDNEYVASAKLLVL